MLCDAYDKPLTQAEAARIAGEVKDAYPARLRALLDQVEVVLSPDELGDVFLSTGTSGTELAIPATYLRTQCLLTFGAMIYSNMDAARRALDAAARSDICPRDMSRLACLLFGIDALQQESIRSDPQSMARVAPMIRLLAEGALKYAVAHEYGHAIIAAAWRGRKQPAAFDPELAADLEALQPMLSTQITPLSDSLLFGGRMLLERFAGAGGAPGNQPHEPTICRALRSSLIRSRLLPILMRLVAPKSASTAPPAAMPPITYAGEDARCSANLPREVRRVEADLVKIERFVAELPARRPDTLPRWAEVETVPVHTQTGRSVRNVIAGSARLERAVGGDLSPAAGDASVSERAERLRALDALARETGIAEVASREYRVFLYFVAMGRLFLAPPGSSYLGQIVALRDAFDAADRYGEPDMQTGSLRALSYFLEARCDEGYATLRRLEALRAAHNARFSGELAGIVGAARPFNALLQSLVDAQARGAGEAERAARCMAFARDTQTGMMALYGWSG